MDRVTEQLESETRPYLEWDIAAEFMTKAFVGYGLPQKDAELCTDVLLESDRRGIESHGVNRFKPIYLDRIKAGILNPVTEVDIVREAPSTAVIDAHDGMGMVASRIAMDLAIEKAGKYGTACVAVRNSSHYGIAGYWTSMANDRGMIGITGTNARPSIAPTFGVDPMMGTNPLTIGIPTDEGNPFMIDCATSITQNGKIEFYERVGKKTPEGLVIGRDGKTMTDPGEILKAVRSGQAALSPLGGIGEELGGYKGYGYTTAVEMLSAALAGGIFLRDITNIDASGSSRPYHLGHFFIVIDPDAFIGREEFNRTTGEIARQLRASSRVPGEERIYVAGDKEWIAKDYRKDKGVPVGESVQNDFISIRDELGIDIKFPFE